MAEDEGRAARIRQLRKDSHLRWKQIAEHVGVEMRSAQMWQETGAISYENAKKLAELAGVDVDYIMRGEQPLSPDLALVPEPSPAIENTLADILRNIQAHLDDQTRVLGEIKATLAAARDVKDGTEHLLDLIRELREGTPEASPPSSSEVPQQPDGAATTPATEPHPPPRP